MQQLLGAIRALLTPAEWSRGVTLSREGRVRFVRPQALGEDEVTALVVPASGGAAAQVSLWPEDTDDGWSCDCNAVKDACVHAAAAAIALGQARAGKPLAAAGSGQAGNASAAAAPLLLAYTFTREPTGLGLMRCVVGAGTGGEAAPTDRPPEPLHVPLALRQRQPGPPLQVLPSDLKVDALLAGRRLQGALGQPLLQRILEALVDADHVFLAAAPRAGMPPAPADWRRVTVAPGTFALEVVATRRAGGAFLQGRAPEGLSESFGNGAGRFGTRLCALFAPPFSERDLRALRAGQSFAPEAFPELLGEVLPRLSRHLKVDCQGLRAPEMVRLPPLLAFWVRPGPANDRPADAAQVVAQVVYGAPLEGPTPARAATTAAAQAPLPVRADGKQVILLGRVVGDALRASQEAGAPVPQRDRQAEARLCQRLDAELGLVPGQARQLTGAQDVDFVARLRASCRRRGDLLVDPGALLEHWRVLDAVQPSWRSPTDLATPLGRAPTLDDALVLDCWHTADAADDGLMPAAAGRRATVSLAAALAAHDRNERYLPVPGGGFARVPGPLLAAHLTPLRAFLAAREQARTERAAGGGRAPWPAWGNLALGELAAGLALPAPPQAEAAYQQLQAAEALALPADAAAPRAPTPEALAPVAGLSPTVVLRSYQRHGVAWLRARAQAGIGALLADDMGLGKTLQTLASLSGRVLVVAPTSVLSNWADEAARFRPDAQVITHHGSQRDLARLTAQLAPNSWVLTSYGILRLEAQALAKLGFLALVLDEAHVIKRTGTQAWQAANHVGQSCAFRLALSGTPLENSPDELWSLIQFLNPGLLGSAEAFARETGRALAAAGGDAGAAFAPLRQRLAPLLLRRLKREVAQDLPPRTDVVLRTPLSAAEKTVYDALAQATRKDVVARLEAGQSVMAALEALLRLRQAACHVGLLPGHGDFQHSAKLALLVAKLAEGVAEGHRALVFSQWTQLLDRLEPWLKDANIAFARLDGSTKDRGAVVQTFSAEQGPPVLLMSLKAGGVGLNLTAADHVFLLDPWWNPAAEDQAADRANRMGQTRPVLVHRLISEGTVEEGILALQAHKRALASAALSGEVPAAGHPGAGRAGLSRADLLALLGGAAA